MLAKLKRLLVLLTLLIVVDLTSSAPKTWPYMKTYDIWETNKTTENHRQRRPTLSEKSMSFVHDNLLDGRKNNGGGLSRVSGRRAKVINFFSLPSDDDECLSDDGRRIGMCMNVYECRIQGGLSRGDCALGFGVCCVFESTCDQEVYNNITYFVSPKFPGIMPNDKENCTLKIKLVSDDISQIRLDFMHFTLSQPNRMTGVCDSDIFSMEGGALPFVLCGQNSGQHAFYDLASPKARAEKQELKININLNKRAISSRLWEIRISQIPFSSKAPTGCTQYFTGTEGIIQTFNFAENGRHLANQRYKACVRQEKSKCSIQYEPCNDQSFRIGPMGNNGMGGMMGVPGMGVMPGGVGGVPGSAGGAAGMPGVVGDPAFADDPQLEDEMQVLDDTAADDYMAYDDDTGAVDDDAADDAANNDPNNDLTQMDPPDSPDADADDTAGSDTGDQQADETQQQDPQDDEPQQDEPADEGSGGDGGGFFGGFPSFSFPSFFRSFTGRQSRQLYSPCTDRITLPCIVEDFLEAGMGDIPTCIPIHCGNSLCQAGVSSCKIETSVTPFYIGVHFGDGGANKGSPEDNIGACLRYKQLPCS